MMMKRDPNLKEEVGGSITGYEISSRLDRKLAGWSTTSSALVLACRPSGFFSFINDHLHKFSDVHEFKKRLNHQHV